MREIEFRGKDCDNEWRYGQLTIIEDEYYINYLDEVIGEFSDTKYIDYVGTEVSERTLGQYTGIKDKNGTKIFEGDIIKYIRKNMYAPTTGFHNQDLISLHKIYWNEEKHQFYQEHYKLPELKCIGGGTINFEDERADENIIEVIGNIYDNPELLEKLVEE